MPDTTHSDDSLYHRLFSHPEIVADLLSHFLDSKLLAELDCSQMKRLNTKHTALTGERRQGEMLYRQTEGARCSGVCSFAFAIFRVSSRWFLQTQHAQIPEIPEQYTKRFRSYIADSFQHVRIQYRTPTQLQTS